jgi:capsular exopolysaccharide synthesis family protein
MFRMLRTNLQYARVGEASQTIVLTSHVSGEGKSFITLNLGISMALAGYKTVIIGLDLRKPKLSKYLDFDIDAKGISQYLVGAVTKEEIIHPVQIQEKLSFIPSGPIPPNPGELLQSEKLQQLLTELSKKFDYILIDSPPVGLVSDAMVLNQYASRTIFVVHYAVTRRDFLKTLEEEYQQGKLQRPAIVFNGVKASANYGYGNKYGYGYGYGYYEEDGKGAKNKKIKS